MVEENVRGKLFLPGFLVSKCSYYSPADVKMEEEVGGGNSQFTTLQAIGSALASIPIISFMFLS